MRTLTTSLFCLIMTAISAQTSSDPLSGNYTGFYNGDNISLVLVSPTANVYTGTMNDSYQTYAMQLTMNGRTLTGTATESSMGLVFQVKGNAPENQLNLNFQIVIEGTKAEMDIAFTKQGKVSAGNAASQSTMQLPANAEHPAALIGTWTKEELYQSGYGDNYMGGGFSQSMTFLANGQVAEGGSNAYISGSNYSGQSSGTANGVVAGVLWYTQGNQLYLLVTENGVTQAIHLGKYYIEGQNMLITGTNGEKILMNRG